MPTISAERLVGNPRVKVCALVHAIDEREGLRHGRGGG